jgi:hypothetical protein
MERGEAKEEEEVVVQRRNHGAKETVSDGLVLTHEGEKTDSVISDDERSGPLVFESDVTAVRALHQVSTSCKVGVASKPPVKHGHEESDEGPLETGASVVAGTECDGIVQPELLTAGTGSGGLTAEENASITELKRRHSQSQSATTESDSHTPVPETPVPQTTVPQTPIPPGDAGDPATASLLASLPQPHAALDNQSLRDKWYITFEQFISSVQAEPDLCQFFAEQNAMDLDSSSVDLVLTPYTRMMSAQR